MTKSPSEFRHEVRQVVFPKEVKKEEQTERKRKRERERSKMKLYYCSTVKWNRTKHDERAKYQTTLKNARNSHMPLAVFIKEAAASENLKIGYFPTQEEQKILIDYIIQERQQRQRNNVSQTNQKRIFEHLLLKILRHSP